MLYGEVKNAVIELLHVNVHNHVDYGIYIQLSKVANDSAGIVAISSATFINNDNALTITSEFRISIYVKSSTFSNTLNGVSQKGMVIYSNEKTLVNVSNSLFCNDQNGAVIIQIYSVSGCAKSSIVFTNVTIYNTTRSDSHSLQYAHTSVYIVTEDTVVYIMF